MGEVRLILEAGPAAPEWIRVLPVGEVRLHDGRGSYQVTPEDLDRLVAAHEAKGLDLVIDYEHQSLTGGKAPAAGWIKELEAREDGLWARVEWTAAARQHLEAREYRYFSPVLRVESDSRRLLELVSLALTNTPAIAGLPPLVAKARAALEAERAARAKKYGIGVKEGGNLSKPAEWAAVPEEEWGDPVNWRYPLPDAKQARAAWAYWHQAGNQEQYTQAERRVIEERIRRRAQALGVKIEGEKMKEKLSTAMHLAEGAAEEEILAAAVRHREGWTALREVARLVELPETATPGEITGAVLALKQGAEALSQVQQEVAQLKAARAEEQARAAVAQALQAGKLTPAQEEWAMAYARRDLEGFRAFAAKAPQVVPVNTRLQEAGGSGGGSGLDQDELAVCRQLGLKTEAFAATKKHMEGGDHGSVN